MRDPSLAPVIRALTAEPSERELDGIGPALAELRARVAQESTGPRRHRVLATAFGAKLGATLGGVAAGLVGVGTVLLVSTHLPSGAQLPAGLDGSAQPHPAAVSTTAPPRGPDANGPAKHGLCTAWTARSSHGSQAKVDGSVAFANLVEAAGGADKVAAFCADVLKPRASGKPGNGAGTANGKAKGKGNGKSTDKPKDKPEKQSGGAPTDEPTDDSATGTPTPPTTTPVPTTPTPTTTTPTTTTPTTPASTPTTSPATTTGTPVPQGSATVEPGQTVGP
jgi:hypothetical protein